MTTDEYTNYHFIIMRDFIKDLFWLICLSLVCGLAYLLPMLLFAWSLTWPHWVLIVVFVFLFGTIHTLFSLLGSMIAALPLRTLLGKILASIVIVLNLSFSILAVWKSLPHNDGWGIAVDVYATYIYLVIFLGSGYALWKKEEMD